MFSQALQTARPIEDVLCSKTRMKILRLLVDLGQLNTSQVAGRVGLNYVHILADLTVLEENGLVRQVRCGRARYYRLDEDSRLVSALKQAILASQG